MKIRITRFVIERAVVEVPDGTSLDDCVSPTLPELPLYDRVVNDLNWFEDSEVTDVEYEEVRDELRTNDSEAD